MEEKFRRLSAQILDEFGQANAKTKKLVEEIASRLCEEKLSVLRTMVDEHSLQNKVCQLGFPVQSRCIQALRVIKKVAEVMTS